MFVGADTIRKMMKDGVIRDFNPEQINIEGCGLDLRIGELNEMDEGLGRLMINTRESPTFKKVHASFLQDIGKPDQLGWSLEPNRIYLAKTIESITVPKNMVAFAQRRATLVRSGILVDFARADAGYSGQCVVMMVNLSNRRFTIERGARVVQLFFGEVSGETNSYIGQWQDGRVFIPNTEEQTRQA